MHPVIARYIEAYNAMDVAAMMATLHPEIVFENFTRGELTASARGEEAMRALAETSLGMFRSRKQTVTSIVAGPDRTRATIAFEAVLANGETIALTGTSEFHLRDGLIDTIVDWS